MFASPSSGWRRYREHAIANREWRSIPDGDDVLAPPAGVDEASALAAILPAGALPRASSAPSFSSTPAPAVDMDRLEAMMRGSDWMSARGPLAS